MSGEDTNTNATGETGTADTDRVDDAGSTDTGTDAGDGQGLGDAGKKALEAMKAERAAARKEARDAKAALATTQAELEKLRGGTTDAAADAAAKAVAEATSKANQRILRAEIKAAAGSKLSDPADAIRLLDLDQFEVGADGEVDAKEIADAIDELLKNKPYLAAQGGRRFPASADGGARNGSQVAQLTEQDLKRMTPEQIVEARRKGQLVDLL